MGNNKSKSSSYNTIVNNTINKNDISSLEKTSLNVGIDVLNKASQKCSSTIAQNNACKISGINASGDFNFSSNQTNTALSNLSCINDQKVSSEMVNAMTTSVLGSLDALNGTESASALNSSALAKSETSFGSTGGGASTNTSSNVTNNITNETKVAVQSILENNFKSNFTAEMLSECINRTTQQNQIDISDVNANNVTIPCIQTNSLQQVTQCKAMQEAISATLNNTAKELGFKVETTSDTSSTAEATTSATAESKATGLVDEMFNGISGIIDSMFGGGVIGSLLCVVCCVIIFGLCIYCLYSRYSSKIPKIPERILDETTLQTLDSLPNWQSTVKPYIPPPSTPYPYQNTTANFNDPSPFV